MRILLFFIFLNLLFGCGIKGIPEEREGKMDLFLGLNND